MTRLATIDNVRRTHYLNKVMQSGAAGIAALIAAVILLALINGVPVNLGLFRQIVLQSPILIVAATGQALIMVTGGFDLSVGAVMALTSVITAITMNTIGGVGVVIGIAAGAVVGCVNGILVVYGHVQPLITTLGTMTVSNGIALLISGSGTVRIADRGAYFAALTSSILGVPVQFLIAAVLAILAWLMLRYSRPGVSLRMTGSNPDAAAMIGVRVKFYTITAYICGGTAGGIAGAILVAASGTGLPTVGANLALQSISACLVAGVLISGGRANLISVAISALAVQALAVVQGFAGISPFIQNAILGLVLIAAGASQMFIRGVRSWRESLDRGDA